MGIVGRGREPGGAVQEADRRPPQIQRIGGQPAVALVGQEGGDVRRRCRQRREMMRGAPAAPGPHRRPVGGPGVVGLGAAAIAARRGMRPGQRAVGVRPRRRRRPIEPDFYKLRRATDRGWRRSGRWQAGRGQGRGRGRGRAVVGDCRTRVVGDVARVHGLVHRRSNPLFSVNLERLGCVPQGHLWDIYVNVWDGIKWTSN